ncbi:MAG TPA: hypothetical protein ENK35_08430, partial [Candidatus Tenderia sp.]|nr:hypothetical protein [Candidatus Tenderia sp.]
MKKRILGRSKTIVAGVLLLGMVLITAGVGGQSASAQFGTDVYVMGEFVRNGQFDVYNSISETPYGWWFDVSPGYPTKVVFDNGNPVLRIQPPLLSSSLYLFIWQEIPIPKQTELASLSFKYRLVPDQGQARIRVQFETDTGRVLGNTTFTSSWYPSDSGWVTDTTSLSASFLQEFDTAHANGERVYLVIGYERSQDDNSYVLLDDISLWIQGWRFQPYLNGAIAFVGQNSSGQYTVEWVYPDGSHRTTAWTYPSGLSAKLWKPVWRPNGEEIAFASGHEASASPYLTDIYAVKPDGSGLRRVTNPPAMADVQSGYQYGTVTGQILNNYGSVTSMLLYVEGAKSPVAHYPGAYQATTSFTIPNVADLGAGENQNLYITWGDGACATGVEWELGTSIDVQPGQTIDIGTISFDGDCNQFEASNPTWKRDGSEIGFSGAYLAKRAQASGEALGRDLFSSSAGMVGKDLDWSPANDTVLFQGQSGGNFGIFHIDAGGSSATQRVLDSQFLGAVTEEQAWLPDGSTFVYSTSDGQIYEYNPSGNDTQLLALNYESVEGLSVSPDGNYIVFERVMKSSHELWILDRLQPNTLWPLVTDFATDPDWARSDPVIPQKHKVYL